MKILVVKRFNIHAVSSSLPIRHRSGRFVTEKSDYYNTPTIHQIQKEMEVIDSRNKFSLIEDCKKFLIDIAEDIMEETPTIDNLVILEEENNDRLVLKNMKDIISLIYPFFLKF